MPNFDTGHYFLTVLAPIKNGAMPSGETEQQSYNTSYVQQLRQRLAILPTALQSPATEQIGINSPFANEMSTHFSRMLVINDVVFNGRTYRNPIVDALGGHDPLSPQKVDNLSSSYLLWTVDFDAVREIGDPLPTTLTEKEQDEVRDAYLRRAWTAMEAELQEIFSHCYGFENVKSRGDFVAYIRKCQVETTMPFNDYWLETPKLPSLNVTAILAAVGIPAVVTVLALISWLIGAGSVLFVLPSPGWTFIVAALLTALAVWLSYKFALKEGMRAMPPGPYADLPGVLKSLYVQQTFSQFAIDSQGLSDEALHNAFGKYCDKHKPDDRMTPSQRPGFIAINRKGAIVKAGERAAS
ncbi:hypothetical protein [Fulvimarina sp. MAC8]|uniref:hypothetical protein n=1 Tax=Fulvimarina sp. MAC8 TaxID=3162874 RepID=UPI0032EECBCC